MKTTLPLIIAVVGTLIISGSSQAQTIVWGSAHNMVSDSDVVANVGTLFDAGTVHGSNLTVNGVNFNGLTTTSLPPDPYQAFLSTDGKISIAMDNSYGAIGAGNFSGGSTSYGQLVDTTAYSFYLNDKVTLSGLTVGDTYQVQVWSYYAGTTANDTTTLTGTTPVALSPLTGQYAIGTFTASSTTETFEGVFSATGNDFINAIAVFDTTATPEPSTIALFAVAVMGLILQLGRKRRVLAYVEKRRR